MKWAQSGEGGEGGDGEETVTLATAVVGSMALPVRQQAAVTKLAFTAV